MGLSAAQDPILLTNEIYIVIRPDFAALGAAVS
jgi:hypothetical protein